MHGWRKAISPERDRLQSNVLLGVLAPLLAAGASLACAKAWSVRHAAVVVASSAGFAVLTWAMRSATASAAAMGMLICVVCARDPGALTALVTMFVLTFLATRFGRRRKESRGVAESRRGRRASQVVANLGVAGLCAAVGWYPGCIAAFAEAAADTMSSEVGQAVGGRAWLITTLRPVQPGQDGGISVVGTLAGLVAAATVVAGAAAALGGSLRWSTALIEFAAACAGLFFDSLLGATVEERGWLGNDLVNFLSTCFVAVVVWIAVSR